ncbi:MAG: hypothetical protein N3B10_11010 [Armatimonadetes bacterium]|nr:hypothetical protein [Armatimonadota bacterium]MCX7968996.1 hypothetical protein [Armatimonadota bacterium]MDW8142979.1 hypothetical protein [Armatimonadota bacterium]
MIKAEVAKQVGGKDELAKKLVCYRDFVDSLEVRVIQPLRLLADLLVQGGKQVEWSDSVGCGFEGLGFLLSAILDKYGELKMEFLRDSG